MFAFVSSPRGAGTLLPVRTPQQMDHYLRESELLTGSASRLFVIASADRLRYRVRWTAQGCEIERLDALGNPLDTVVLGCDEFLVHPLVDALRSGQLYTPPARH
ncbi:hypothetical protein [Xanthomonas hortorum]|uniref:Uncharacterized protein n=1 Tax=Xanthomonas hortorum pv. hederae TaxID=453603 RepID=A0A9X4H9B5_9XANT|nr:hypothetical protein [Xanthomonas hortorum]MCE4369686.1 hypothetical protein [Xanthomonas hortorum pv. hederae]MDC8640167.1 hypothetical protein [Xanthomonas hortorum pv. hederae]PPU86226.1 hypothetical protein XhhCFBP4925_00395 [Xanthomonas hortorum pv. hederae]PUF01353.1 hypothetical protein C7T87_03265 [Xanthomonas hortorum pv. hederae]